LAACSTHRQGARVNCAAYHKSTCTPAAPRGASGAAVFSQGLARPPSGLIELPQISQIAAPGRLS
jgi:hypothetical protein